MRSSLLFLLSPFVAVADRIPTDKLEISFDKSLEGRIGINKVVEDVVEKVSGETKRKSHLDTPGNGVGILDQRDLTSPARYERMVDKRQSYCDAGYGYCSSFDRCCPSDTRCCSYGYCLESDTICCPNGPCSSGEECCGSDTCMEAGAQCCSDGSHCPAGNNCYIVEGYVDMRCCTNSRCTAYIDETGSTSMASTSTTTRTYTTTSTQYYYWTVTWWYYSYYWTYSINIEASIVTSTRETTSSTLSVRTTDSFAAQDYFSSLSSDLELPTPASATSLESLAGETSYVSETITETASAGFEETASSAPESTGSPDEPGSGDSSPQGGGGGGGGSNMAAGFFDRSVMAFLTFGMGVGVAAVML